MINWIKQNIGDSKTHKADARQNKQEIRIGGTHCGADLCENAGG